ncbi:MAG TPA: PQQ-binding-like beta-propeller repeat protein [Vicinamibacterales bacterium]|jgi:outer membrane protein assembly factor BamB|nr:PQQ-binding-like beta-propeller repeat protein [Vicinamibacterales bacterium]
MRLTQLAGLTALATVTLVAASGPPASVARWPSFRGPSASGVADGQSLPDTWDGTTGRNIRWRVPIPGLAHSSPIVWDDRIYVTSAISSQANVTFKPGLYGEGTASEDRSPQRWVVIALDRETGRTIWQQTAYEGVPREKRHIKATYANATPATDGKTIVAFFGSQGLYAFDMNGRLRWKKDLGVLNTGAYDLPEYEWGTASSPIIYKNLAIVQCDTQNESFVLAADLATGKTVWKTVRKELPSWGTPTVYASSSGGSAELVTNASNFIRGYDPDTGAERWRLGGSSKITAPTPVFAEGLIVVASGRAPERPIFAIRPGGQGDITPADNADSSAHVAWRKTGRGSYMPTPLIYKDVVYVLGNAGLLDAYDLRTGREIYRQRLEHRGSGFSASPVAADTRIYLSSEDGDMFVVQTGAEFKLLAKNPMGEPLMATPAIAGSTMYVRGERQLFAVGRQAANSDRQDGR